MHLKQNFNIVFCSGLFYNRVSRACKSSPEKRIVYEVEKICNRRICHGSGGSCTHFTGGTSVTAKAAVNTKSDIEIATRLHNYSRSASPIGSYLVDIGNGNMMRVQFDYDSSNIYVEYYDSQYNVTGVRQLAPELPIYGGFYSGSDAYYIVTGQKMRKNQIRWNVTELQSMTRTGTESVQPDCMIVTHFFRFVQDV